MPHFSAMAALKLLKDSGHDLPFIIVSGSIGEDVAVAAMKSGAHDYVMKDNLTRLCACIEREMREAEVRRERERAEAAFQHQAHYDWLTDLPNRVMFNDRLTIALAQATRNRK